MNAMFSVVMLVTLTVFQGCWGADKINWVTSYDQAVEQSKTTQKPILLFFTGSGWCGYCERLEKEALNTQEFADAVANQFIFVKLNVQQDGTSSAETECLTKQYKVRGYPTLILLDSKDQKQIGVTGYKQGGGKSYANHLQKMVTDYSAYKQGVTQMSNQKISGRVLKSLLDKSRTLELENDEVAIIQAGMDSDQKLFFQIERYRHLAQAGLVHEPEAVALKQQLLAADPTNAHKTHYSVAVIEFETFSNEMETENYSPEIAVAPLVSYIERFGAQDKQNKWRLQMIISQVFLDKNKLALALRYAQSSYEAAPATVQPEIATAIRNLKSQSEQLH